MKKALKDYNDWLEEDGKKASQETKEIAVRTLSVASYREGCIDEGQAVERAIVSGMLNHLYREYPEVVVEFAKEITKKKKGE